MGDSGSVSIASDACKQLALLLLPLLQQQPLAGQHFSFFHTSQLSKSKVSLAKCWTLHFDNSYIMLARLFWPGRYQKGVKSGDHAVSFSHMPLHLPHTQACHSEAPLHLKGAWQNPVHRWHSAFLHRLVHWLPQPAANREQTAWASGLGHKNCLREASFHIWSGKFLASNGLTWFYIADCIWIVGTSWNLSSTERNPGTPRVRVSWIFAADVSDKVSGHLGTPRDTRSQAETRTQINFASPWNCKSFVARIKLACDIRPLMLPPELFAYLGHVRPRSAIWQLF